MAVGDKNTPPGSTEYGISREFTQNWDTSTACRIGTRGGTVVRHVFPADGFYKLYGRLVRGVEEGYAGVEGQEQPETFVVTIDGEEVYHGRDRRSEGPRGAGQGHERRPRSW